MTGRAIRVWFGARLSGDLLTDDSPDGKREFVLETFLPYLLNQAAKATSQSFQQVYRATHGLTRTQWRILAKLGKFGAMTARHICTLSHLEKTKGSPAEAAKMHDRVLRQLVAFGRTEAE